jgi:hypothetical protein
MLVATNKASAARQQSRQFKNTAQKLGSEGLQFSESRVAQWLRVNEITEPTDTSDADVYLCVGLLCECSSGPIVQPVTKCSEHDLVFVEISDWGYLRHLL